jgi:hypothetical protein
MSQFSFTNNVTGGNAQINQGQTVNATQTNHCGDVSPVQVIEQVQQELKELERATSQTAFADPEIPTPQFTPAEPAFDALTACASELEPEPAKVESAMTLFRQAVAERGPVIGRALCNGVVAGLKASVATHPVIAAITSFLQTFQD